MRRVSENYGTLTRKMIEGPAEAPNPKSQIPSTKEIPIAKSNQAGAPLELGIWKFFGAWDLGFGAFL
jgi:hypothetical protein